MNNKELRILLAKWTLLQLLQLLLVSIHNIDATTNNSLAPWLVAIKVNDIPGWSYGSLITPRAVLTSTNVVKGVNKTSLKILKDCEILLLASSPIELCQERNVLDIRLLGVSRVDEKVKNDVAILILNISFNQADAINIAESFDDVNPNNCFSVSWDFFKNKVPMVENGVAIFNKVSLVNKKSDIRTLIQNRLRTFYDEYAISSVTKESLKTEKGYNITLDEFKDYLGSSLVCTLKQNSSNYLQIGVSGGYLTSQNEKDFQVMIGVYYYDVIRHRSKIMKLVDRDDDMSYWLSAFNLLGCVKKKNETEK